MRWSLNLPSTMVKVEQALMWISLSSWRRQMLVTSRDHNPVVFLPDVDQWVRQRLPLAEARRAQEVFGKGGVIGKLALIPNGSSP